MASVFDLGKEPMDYWEDRVSASLPPPTHTLWKMATSENKFSLFDAVIVPQESPPHKRFLVG